MHFLIIGGSDAGISAALRAHELAPDVEVTVVLQDEFPNFSICGLPFFLSGETPEWRHLAHRTVFDGIEIRLRNATALSISLNDRKVEIADRSGKVQQLRYDRLLVATGARPAQPHIEGANLEGVYPLHTMEDSFRVQAHLNRGIRSAVVVGSGYIGLEMADALVHRGIKVTLMGRSTAVLATVDPDFGQMVDRELSGRGVAVYSGVSVTAIERRDGQLRVHAGRELHAEADLVLVAAGVMPNSELAAAAGLQIGINGAIRVTRRMETSHAGVFAAGDCAETWHRLLERPTYLPLGTTSHKQGRVAGENAVGGDRQFGGSVGTQVVKVFDLAVGRTGLRESEASGEGFKTATTTFTGFDHKAYYPGATEIHTRLTGDRETGRFVGRSDDRQLGSECGETHRCLCRRAFQRDAGRRPE